MLGDKITFGNAVFWNCLQLTTLYHYSETTPNYSTEKTCFNEELNCAEMELYDKYGNVVTTTIFDIEDIPLVQKYKWCLKRGKDGYTDYVECGGSTSAERYLLHRLLMGDYDTFEDTDHKNGNGLDNRKSNLRQCTTTQNLLNRTKQIDSLLGFKNITYRKSGNKYVVQIVMTDEKTKIRKQCSTLQEAINYRNAIYQRFLINVNLFRKEVDTEEKFNYDYDEKNNKLLIHKNGKNEIIYSFLFDFIIHNKPNIFINDKYNPTSIDKFLQLLKKIGCDGLVIFVSGPTTVCSSNSFIIVSLGVSSGHQASKLTNASPFI